MKFVRSVALVFVAIAGATNAHAAPCGATPGTTATFDLGSPVAPANWSVKAFLDKNGKLIKVEDAKTWTAELLVEVLPERDGLLVQIADNKGGTCEQAVTLPPVAIESCGTVVQGGASVQVTADADIAPPSAGFKAQLFTVGDRYSPALPKDVSKWTPDSLATLTKVQAANGNAELDLVFANDATKTVCKQKVVLPGGAPPPPPPPPSVDQPTCEAAGQEWERTIRSQVTGNHYTLTVFTQDGEICYANRLQGVMGDPIFVGIFSDTNVTWSPIQFSPCSLQDTSPAITATGDVSLTGPATTRTAGTQQLIRLPPRTCFNDHVDIKVESRDKQHSIGYALQQYTLYRATLQLGVLFSTHHTNDFDLATDASGATTIHFSGDVGRGPEYVASLVLYGFPNYLKTLVADGSVYRGRDLINDQGFADRIGLVAGIGVTEPTRRFVIGGTFELMYGLNIMFVEDFHRQEILDGVAVGDAFMGTEAQIPTTNVWQHQFVVGISLDLRYVRELFAGHIKP